MKRLLAVCLLFPFLVSTTAFGADTFPRNGHELLDRCQSALRCEESSFECFAEDRVSRGYCFGLIHGILGLNGLYTYAVGEKNSLFCAPDAAAGTTISAERGARIVVSFMRQHLDRLQEEAVPLCVAAFAKAFPCKEPAEDTDNGK